MTGVTIASNLIDMFASLEPASDLEFRRGVDAPTVLIPEMTVAAGPLWVLLVPEGQSVSVS